MNSPENENPSTRPYLIRALHEWCSDNGFSPYIAVQVDGSVKVPMEFVNNGEIVLNVSFDATSSLRLGNDFIEFKARFGGVAREIVVPVSHVIAVYARENGQGMAFPAPPAPVLRTEPADLASGTDEGGGAGTLSKDADPSSGVNSDERPPGGTTGGRGRPQLRRVK